MEKKTVPITPKILVGEYQKTITNSQDAKKPGEIRTVDNNPTLQYLTNQSLHKNEKIQAPSTTELPDRKSVV